MEPELNPLSKEPQFVVIKKVKQNHGFAKGQLSSYSELSWRDEKNTGLQLRNRKPTVSRALHIIIGMCIYLLLLSYSHLVIAAIRRKSMRSVEYQNVRWRIIGMISYYYYIQQY